MLGTINPQTIKIDQQAVVYVNRDHVSTLTIKRFDGRSYKPVDLTNLTRVVLAFPSTDPAIVYDSAVQPLVFSWSGSVLTIDLSDYAMPASILPCYLIAYDAEHPNGQVLVDNNDTTLEFDFRNISPTGTVPAPAVDFVNEAPMDGETYGRKDGTWVTLEAIISGVVSVNGMSGIVVLDAADVGADPTGTAAASMVAHVAAVDPHPQYATDTDLAAHVADTTPHSTILQLDRVGFNTAAGLTAGVGEMVWNATDATMDLGLPGGVTLQAGQEFLIRGLNNSGATLQDGTAVYISGASGNRTVFSKAQANQAAADKTIGILTQDIANNQEGFCTLVGMVRNFNTSGWAEGAELWLSATVAGGITTIKPAAPNNAVRIGYVVRSHASIGSIFVRVQHLESLRELHDVVITAPADGDIIEYDTTSQTWINVPNTGGSGEANTASNVGAGAGVFAQKVGVDLQFKSLVAGAGVTLTPAASTITITAAGGGGAVDSVNGQTGVVVLDTDDIAEGVSNLYFTNARASAAAPVQTVDGQTGNVSLSASYAPLSHVGDTGAAHGAATTLVNGFMTTTQVTKLDGIEPGAQVNVATDIAQSTRTGTTVLVTSSTGADATLTAASTTEAGVMTAADKTKLDGIAPGAQVNVPTDLSLGTITATTIPLNSSTGTDVVLPAATTSLAGLQSAADKAKLDGVATGAIALPAVRAITANENLALANINTFGFNSTASNYTSTIPAQSTVAWTADAEMSFKAASTGTITITAATGVTLNGVLAGSLTLYAGASGSIKRKATDVWEAVGQFGTTAEQRTALGLGAGDAPIFTDLTLTTRGRVSVTTGNPLLGMLNTALTLPNYSGVGFTPALEAGEVGRWSGNASTSGGVAFNSFTTNSPTSIPLNFLGYHGSTVPTVTAISFTAFKHDGATGRQALAATEIAAQFGNGTNARIQMLGDGTWRPVADNTQPLGGASNRWSVVYAGTGTINTSDAREKTEVRQLTSAEIEAAKQLAKEIGGFKFLAAIAAKGDAARTHIGMTVQRAVEIMSAHGLDPFGYGFICHDAWGDEPEVLGEDGEVSIAAKAAGDRYGFRTDELLLFLVAGFEARVSAMEALTP